MEIGPLAIRLAQMLGLDDETKLGQKSILDAEIGRRIWWSLVVAEWYVKNISCLLFINIVGF